MEDENLSDIIASEQRRGTRRRGARPVTTRDMGNDIKPQRLSWAEERARALQSNPEAIPKVIRKLYEMAENGNMDAIKVTLERDFGKVSTPIELDTSGLSTDQKIAALGALTGAEEASSGPAQG